MPQQLNPDDRLEFPPDIAEVVDALWENAQTMQTLPMAALEERLRTLDRQARVMGYQSLDEYLRSVPLGR